MIHFFHFYHFWELFKWDTNKTSFVFQLNSQIFGSWQHQLRWQHFMAKSKTHNSFFSIVYIFWEIFKWQTHQTSFFNSVKFLILALWQHHLRLQHFLAKSKTYNSFAAIVYNFFWKLFKQQTHETSFVMQLNSWILALWQHHLRSQHFKAKKYPPFIFSIAYFFGNFSNGRLPKPPLLFN